MKEKERTGKEGMQVSESVKNRNFLSHTHPYSDTFQTLNMTPLACGCGCVFLCKPWWVLNARVSLLRNSGRIKALNGRLVDFFFSDWQSTRGTPYCLFRRNSQRHGSAAYGKIPVHSIHCNSLHFLKCLIFKKKRKQVFPRQEGCTRGHILSSVWEDRRNPPRSFNFTNEFETRFNNRIKLHTQWHSDMMCTILMYWYDM